MNIFKVPQSTHRELLLNDFLSVFLVYQFLLSVSLYAGIHTIQKIINICNDSIILFSATE
jgi:hypothetical protein